MVNAGSMDAKILSSTNFVRVYGMLNNPNSLALVMFFAIAAVFFLRWAYKNNEFKWTFRIAQVAFFGMLLLTLSRGTWISAFMLVLFFILLSRNWQLLKRIAISFVVAIALIYFPVNWGVSFLQNLGVENTVAPEEISWNQQPLHGNILGRYFGAYAGKWSYVLHQKRI